MAKLRIHNGPEKHQVYELGESEVVIGRDVSCDIQLGDKGASRQHAEIFRIGTMTFIRDLASRNGTYLNEEAVEEEMLCEGDQIQIGETTLVFEENSEEQLEFFDEEETSATIELKLEDLSDINAEDNNTEDHRRLRGLYRLGKLTGKCASENDLTQKILPYISELTGAETVYLFVRDPQTGAITPRSQFGAAKQGAGGRISRSIIKRAIIDNRAILVSDAMNDQRFNARQSVMIKGIRSVICVPLGGENLGGVLYMTSDDPANVFQDDDLELAAALGQQVGLALGSLRAKKELHQSLMSAISAMVTAAEMRDPASQGRSARVAHYAECLAQTLGLSAEQRRNLRLAGLLHNIGILGEKELGGYDLEKPSKTDGRQGRVKSALAIVAPMTCRTQIEATLANMYEREDGSGPLGKTGGEIPPAAKILGLAIDFELLADKQGAGDADEKERLRATVSRVKREAGQLYDHSAVEALLTALRAGTLRPKRKHESDAAVMV